MNVILNVIVFYIFSLNCSCKLISIHINKDDNDNSNYSVESNEKSIKIIINRNNQSKENVIPISSASLEQYKRTASQRHKHNMEIINQEEQKTDSEKNKYTRAILSSMEETGDLLLERPQHINRDNLPGEPQTNSNVIHDTLMKSFGNVRQIPEIMALQYPSHSGTEQENIQKPPNKKPKRVRKSKKRPKEPKQEVTINALNYEQPKDNSNKQREKKHTKKRQSDRIRTRNKKPKESNVKKPVSLENATTAELKRHLLRMMNVAGPEHKRIEEEQKMQKKLDSEKIRFEEEEGIPQDVGESDKSHEEQTMTTEPFNPFRKRFEEETFLQELVEAEKRRLEEERLLLSEFANPDKGEEMMLREKEEAAENDESVKPDEFTETEMENTADVLNRANYSIEVDDQEHQAVMAVQEQSNEEGRGETDDEKESESLTHYAYSVSIQRMGAHYASGALVGARWILSSAAEFYNVRESVRLFQVRVGSVDCKKSGSTSHIQSITIHPEFVHGYPGFDISMLKTAETLEQNSVVKPIDISRVTGKVVNAQFLSTYWPRIVFKDGVMPTKAKERVKHNNMRVSTQKLVPTSQCKKLLSGVNSTLDKNSLCLRRITIHHSLCAPDAGAPVVADDGLWGITSGWVSDQCPYVVLPTLFTRVATAPIRSWINEQMTQFETS